MEFKVSFLLAQNKRKFCTRTKRRQRKNLLKQRKTNGLLIRCTHLLCNLVILINYHAMLDFDFGLSDFVLSLVGLNNFGFIDFYFDLVASEVALRMKCSLRRDALSKTVGLLHTLEANAIYFQAFFEKRRQRFRRRSVCPAVPQLYANAVDGTAWWIPYYRL